MPQSSSETDASDEKGDFVHSPTRKSCSGRCAPDAELPEAVYNSRPSCEGKSLTHFSVRFPVTQTRAAGSS